MNNVQISYMGKETRPAVILDDVNGIAFNNFKAQGTTGQPTIIQRSVSGFSIQASASVPPAKIKKEAPSVLVPDPPARRGQN